MSDERPKSDTAREGSLYRAAVLGSPIGHSLSPVLHRAAYEALGLHDWRYDLFAVGGVGEPSLPAFLETLGPEWVGLSLTLPLKEAALACAASSSPHARLLGAANTLVRRGPGWHADSTDAYGARVSLQEAGVRHVDEALLLGAGATARSVLAALAELGCRRIAVAVRDQARPETLALADAVGVSVSVLPLAGLSRYVTDFPVVVSTLPTGTDLGLEAGDAPPGDVGSAPREGAVVLDVVYAGWPTPLARWAAIGGATVVSGRQMLLHQACEQVRLMTGRAAPVAAMRAALAAA
ncbi:MAG: shikimate dehydrogenase [Dermatophilaceae bacterium]